MTATSTTAVVGQIVSLTANRGTNALSWTTTPATSVTKTYSVTTEETNYFTFSQPGNYIIGVRARPLELDSMHICNPLDRAGHHILDSL